MKKREFLAMGGAVPLMLAGCGGNSSGSAQVRLVNASVGYANLGFMVNTTQATTSDVAYGAASPFESVEAGTVTTTLTTTVGGVTSNLPVTTKTLVKDNRYSLVAYGYPGAPKSILINENQTAPTTGDFKFNVLNTSTDLGTLDVYLTASGVSLVDATPISANVAGASQSPAASQTAGTYDITVVGAGSVTNGTADVRLTIPGVVFVDQQIVTLILTPGSSGVLASGILLTQATSGAVVNYPTALVRVRAIAATGISGVVSVGTPAQNIMQDSTSPDFSDYRQIAAGAAPVVTVDGNPVTLVTTGSLTSTTLEAGKDYTVLVYGTEASPKAELFFDDNRLPSVATSVKVRLLNAVLSTAGPSLNLTLNINSTAVASGIPIGSASDYGSTTALNSVQSTVSVTSGFSTIVPSFSQPLAAGNIYTMVVAGQGSASDVSKIVYNFSAARL